VSLATARASDPGPLASFQPWAGPLRGPGSAAFQVLVARWIRSVSALISPVGPVGSGSSGADCSGSDTYRHSTAHRCNANAANVANATNASVMNANARTTDAGAATTTCEGVS